MMIDSLFFKELPLKMGAHICGIDWFHIHFIGVKIGIFPFVSKPGIPSPVLSAKQPHRKVPCVRNVDGCGAPMQISALGARGGAFCMSMGGADVRLVGERTM